MQKTLIIESPKLKRRIGSQWDDCFPYYAGFPESFASRIIETASLSSKKAVIFDPWNGSGTTTYAAAKLGYNSHGMDLNPVMVLVARARALYPTEAGSIEPQAKSLIKGIGALKSNIEPSDPLLQWFTFSTASTIRNLERRIRNRLVSADTRRASFDFEEISCFAATFYISLFSICRAFAKPFRSTNPTWLKIPKDSAKKISLNASEILTAFVDQAKSMAIGLRSIDYSSVASAKTEISVGNTTTLHRKNFADLIITSPPYCTRIDYTAATRIELAVLHPLLDVSRETLSQQMIGSIKVPNNSIVPDARWGNSCIEFLKRLEAHRSKASGGYYYKTHLDYFQKMSKSMENVGASLKKGGRAILVVQDSYYKELHNDVPLTLIEMAANCGLDLFHRVDFSKNNPMAAINPKSKNYRSTAKAVESVICFKK
ncbi:DNA methyltransferase [Variovorax paradoxus]|uniref:DNA methyltransferase n=1 Tax=Variovorax paradoxus TaxID=34073 RepID=UPI001427A22C|nr:DNA methyltransferase [Variovorax paradoxus]